MTIKESEDKWAWIMERAAQILMSHEDVTVLMAMTVAWTEHELIYGSSVTNRIPDGILGRSPLSQWKGSYPA